jgi:hypothetical protein
MLTKRVASENFEHLRFKLSYSTSAREAPRYGGGVLRYRQWDVSQWGRVDPVRQYLFSSFSGALQKTYRGMTAETVIFRKFIFEILPRDVCHTHSGPRS